MPIWRFCWLIIILVVIGQCQATDIPFVFEKSLYDVASYTTDQLESIRSSSPDLVGVTAISALDDYQYVETYEIGGVRVDLTVEDLRRLFDARETGMC
jgi:hypothetical protein